MFSNNAALKYHKLDTCLPNNIKLHSWLRSLDKKCEFIFLPEFNSNEKKQFKVEKTYISRSLVLGSNSKLFIPASLKNVEQKDGFFLLSFIPVDTAIFNTNNLPTNSLNSLSSSRYHNEFEEVEKLGMQALYIFVIPFLRSRGFWNCMALSEQTGWSILRD